MQRTAAARLTLAALVCSTVAASAQTGDAGASAAATEPGAPHTAPAATNDPSSGAAPSADTEPGTVGAGFPKSLTPQQSLPENLQGWLRERSRRHPALTAWPPVAPSPSVIAPADTQVAPEAAVEGYKRRLQSFDEGGVTVLSNRATPPPPPLVRVRAAAAVGLPAPVPAVAEPEREAPSVTETHSLRAKQSKPPQVVSEQGPGWQVFAVPVAAISLALLWLRRRRAAD